MVDVHALLARLAEGDPALFVPALAAALVLLAAAGVADLFARDELIEARLATGISRPGRNARGCRCGATRPDAAHDSKPRRPGPGRRRQKSS